jgi:c(7)-type cytochrome triheme protein
MTARGWAGAAAAVIALLAGGAIAADLAAGKGIYDSGCIGCHGTGILGAPKFGDAAAWGPRAAAGAQALVNSARAGKGSMPPKGGNSALTDEQLMNVISYMVGQSGGFPTATAKPASPAPTAASTTLAQVAAAPAKAAAPARTAPAAPAAAAAPAPVRAAADDGAGKAIYEGGCVACHGTGMLGAPKFGDAAAWGPRAAGGLQALVNSARAGKGSMPPKGGNAALTDAQLLSAVSYMVSKSGGIGAAGSKTPAAPLAPPPPVKAAAGPPAPAAVAAVAPAPALVGSVAATPVVASAPLASVNAFNRLLRPSQRNRPPSEDQIHDPGNDGTLALQPPLVAFNDLTRSNAGNRVDWVKSLREGKIAPRADRLDPNAVPAVMDLNIVREVKGSMPDVVYPHKAHTEWLDCSNCHPAIFIPQKGANQISMAAILLGQKCGVCHGKVAFPVSECRLCHSKSKVTTTSVAAPGPTEPARK